MTARIAIIITIIFISLQMIYACEYNIIWDRDFCNTTDHGRLKNSILPPTILDPVCEFEIGSNITLEHNNTEIYENLYRVNDRNDVSICSASNSTSELLLINVSHTFTLTEYAIGEEVYFISTSNGSKYSAENDKKAKKPCLQLAFRIVQVQNTCDKCNSTIFDNVDSDNFGCRTKMDSLLLIYIAVPLLILVLIGCCSFAFVCAKKSTRRLIQRSVDQQEETADTYA